MSTSYLRNPRMGRAWDRRGYKNSQAGPITPCNCKMATSSPNPVTLATRDQSLQVVFCWRKDRFGHTWQFNGPDGLVPLAVSRDGDVSGPWPYQPVIQELQHIREPDGTLVLGGIGKTNHAYWSLTVRPWREDQIEMDVACRASTIPSFLGSSYQLTADDGRLRLAVDTIDATCPYDISERNREWTCCLNPGTPPANLNFRWRYRGKVIMEGGGLSRVGRPST